MPESLDDKLIRQLGLAELAGDCNLDRLLDPSVTRLVVAACRAVLDDRPKLAREFLRWAAHESRRASK